MTDLTPHRAQHALDHASEIARDHGVEVKAQTLAPASARESAADTILAQVAGHDLLALGAPTVSRARGAFLGGVAATALHRLPVSLLLARRPPGRFGFPRRILIATDGAPGSDGLVRAVGGIAQRCDARVTLLHAVGDVPLDHRQRCAEQAVDLCEVMQVEPIFRSERGRAHDVIVEAARREESSLLAMGSRRLSGARAIGSVSERVAHRAPCSVLVLRPEEVRSSP